MAIISHKISRNPRGALGKIFLRQELESHGIGLCSSLHIRIESPSGDSGEYGYCFGEWQSPKDYYSDSFLDPFFQGDPRWRKIKKTYGTVILPEFLVKGPRILIEVKNGSSAKLEENQLAEFPKILKRGYRIFIVKPILVIEKRKFEVTNYYCTEFLGRGIRKRFRMEMLMKLLSKYSKKNPP